MNRIVKWFNIIDPVNWLHCGRRAVIIHRSLFWLSLVLALAVMTTSLRNSVWIIWELAGGQCGSNT